MQAAPASSTISSTFNGIKLNNKIYYHHHFRLEKGNPQKGEKLPAKKLDTEGAKKSIDDLFCKLKKVTKQNIEKEEQEKEARSKKREGKLRDKCLRSIITSFVVSSQAHQERREYVQD